MKEEHHEDISGIKSGHGKIPLFLVLAIIVLVVWAVYYALIPQLPTYEIVDYNQVQQESGVSVGESLFQETCVVCHGNDLAGIKTKAGSKDRLKDFLADPGTTQPAMAGIKLEQEQIEAIANYLFR